MFLPSCSDSWEPGQEISVSYCVLLTSLPTRDCTPWEFWWPLLSWYMWENQVFFTRKLEPNVSEQFYTGLEKAKYKNNLILNYQKVFLIYTLFHIYSLSLKLIIQIGSKIPVCFCGFFGWIFEPMYIVDIDLSLQMNSFKFQYNVVHNWKYMLSVK